jgi:hypothetical protein
VAYTDAPPGRAAFSRTLTIRSKTALAAIAPAAESVK